MPQLKPRCRLYLQVAAPFTARLKSQLSQAISDFSPACVLIRGAPETLTSEALDGLIDLVQGAGAACLIEDAIGIAADLGADGVHLSAEPTLYGEARKALGESANIGASCGLSRHGAMELAESGADYVAFSEPGGDLDGLTETIAWWSEIFVVPGVAWNIADLGAAERLTKLGVDFIAPPATIWESDAAVEMLRDMDRVIGAIRREA